MFGDRRKLGTVSGDQDEDEDAMKETKQAHEDPFYGISVHDIQKKVSKKNGYTSLP